jgi:hypothetical protein
MVLPEPKLLESAYLAVMLPCLYAVLACTGALFWVASGTRLYINALRAFLVLKTCTPAHVSKTC